MALSSRTVTIPLAGGIDREAHDIVLEPPAHESLVNLVHTEGGALVRRDELANIATTLSEAEALAGFEGGGKERLAALTRAGAYLYTGDSDGYMEPMATSGPRSMDIRRHPIVRSSEGAAVAYSAAAAGYVCHVWTRGQDDDEGAIWFRVDDMETGTPIHGPAQVADMTSEAVSVGTYDASAQAFNSGLQVVAGYASDTSSTRRAHFLVLGREDTGTPNINDPTMACIVTVTNGVVSVGSTTKPISALRARTVVAHCDPSSDTAYAIGFNGTSWTLYEFDISGATVSFTASQLVSGVGSADSALALCHGVSAGRLMAVLYDASVPELVYANVSTASALSGSVAVASLYAVSGTEPQPYARCPTGICETPSGFVVAYEGDDGTTTPIEHVGVKALLTSSVGALTSSTGRSVWNVRLAAQPFVGDDDATLIPLVADHARSPGANAKVSRRQAYIAEVDGADLRRVCEYGQDVVQELGARYLSTASAGRQSPARPSLTYRLRDALGWGWSCMVEDIDQYQVHPSIVTATDLQSAGYVIATPGAQNVRVTHANGTPLAGSGYIAKIDGERFGELMQMPPPHVIEISESGGTNVSYRCCWTWRDAQGVIHRSAPSEAVEDGSTEAALTVAIPPWLDWGSQSGDLPTDVWLEVYTSPQTIGDDIDGAYYRRPISDALDTSPHTTVGDLTSPRYAIRLADIIDPSAPWKSTAVYIDLSEPGELPLYTNGGVLDHDPAPCPVDIVASRDRLWAIDAEDRQAVWYTVPMQAAYAPAFSALLKQRVPTEAGELVALGVIDDLVVFFGSSSIYALEAIGGPDSTGAGGFPPLRRLSTERGCVNPASVITTDAGLLFQSSDGIYALDGSGALQPIGRPVRELLDGRTIRGATVVSDDQQAVWLLDNDTALVFDLEGGQWSLCDYSTEDSGYTAIGTHDGKLVLGVNDGAIWRASSALPVESGEPIYTAMETGWIKLAGLQGFKRVRRLGILGRLRTGATITPTGGTHTSYTGTITLRVAYNYDDSDSDTYTLDLEDGSSVGLDPFHWRAHLARQKCSAIKVTAVYTPSNLIGEPTPGTTRSEYPLRVELVSLAAEVGVKRGIRKIGYAAGGSLS